MLKNISDDGGVNYNESLGQRTRESIEVQKGQIRQQTSISDYDSAPNASKSRTNSLKIETPLTKANKMIERQKSIESRSSRRGSCERPMPAT